MRKTVNTFKNGIKSGSKCSNDATKSSLKVSPGLTRNLTARGLYGNKMNTVKRVWRIITIFGLVENGNALENYVQISNYLGRISALMTSCKEELAIATSWPPWHRLLRGQIECVRFSTIK